MVYNNLCRLLFRNILSKTADIITPINIPLNNCPKPLTSLSIIFMGNNVVENKFNRFLPENTVAETTFRSAVPDTDA